MMFALEGQVLDIVVENQGRIAYGPMMNDNKKVQCWFSDANIGVDATVVLWSL